MEETKQTSLQSITMDDEERDRLEDERNRMEELRHDPCTTCKGKIVGVDGRIYTCDNCPILE